MNWQLETRDSAYCFGVTESGLLVHTYWGKRLPYRDDYPLAKNAPDWASFNNPEQLSREEYPAYGDYKFIDPCLKATFSDGTRDLMLRFKSAEEQPDGIEITLADMVYPFEVKLTYRAHHDYNLIERSTTVVNHGDSPVTIERVDSAQWHMPSGHQQYRMSHLTGRWWDEWHLSRDILTHGIKLLDSKRITTSHHHNPWFAIDTGDATEDQGDVWFAVLAWSGNWRMAAEVTNFNSTRINIGINDWDFAMRLNPGASYTTPSTFGGYTAEGFGGASRTLHDLIRERVIPHKNIEHKVLYNSWEATFFNIDVDSQGKLAELAAKMGVELFVMDDGWFQGRNLDNAGLGDWWPDPAKFPNGLNPLIERVNALGMDFGLWVEPEMVNPDSDLYRNHPDWVIHFPNRERTQARNQLILNFAREDVQDYILEQLDKILANHNIAFIKWDMNRNVSEAGWQTDDHDPREIWLRYVEGLYQVWGTLRERHPDVIWQSCSGGGGRADLGILRLADQIWVSDNTEATARLRIQEGFSQIFPANTMEAWVTDINEHQLSLTFRFHVSMCGSLGVGGHLVRWSEADREEAARQIALYKEIRPIVQHGDQYRLQPAHHSAFTAVQYVAKDKSEAVVFAFRTHLTPPATLPRVFLRGLEPNARYSIEGFEQVRSGAAWMFDGVQIDLKDDFTSTVRRIQRVD